jgi:signal transduction histidine kinase
LSAQSVYFEDDTRALSAQEVLNQNTFELSGKQVLNFNVSSSNFWIKFSISNQSEFDRLLVNLAQSRLDEVEWYELDANNKIADSYMPTAAKSFKERNYEETSFVFNADILPNETKTYLIKVHGNEQLTIPLFVGDEKSLFYSFTSKNFFSGMFIGVIVIMLLYNLFVYFSVKDRSYFYYVLYLAFIVLTQMTIEGYTYKYLWPNSAFIEKHALAFLSSGAGIVLALFVQSILQTRKFSLKIHNLLNLIIVLFSLAILVQVFISIQVSFIVMQNVMLVGSIFTIYAAVVVYRKGQKSARFFLYAWSALIAGSVIFILKDFGVLPFNNFTKNIMQIASALEAVLLSIALSDRINTYREERLTAIQEKEAILSNQNVILEQQVKERTSELNETLLELKETQVQLVQSEKMSSLGQLTAGIAHEINNPMNYARQSVVTIKRDVQDLKDLISKYDEVVLGNNELGESFKEASDFKEEIDLEYLNEEIDNAIDDVEDGIKRAVEIASELKTFSRIDQSSLKEADIHEGLNSTLELMKSDIKQNHIVVEKLYGDIPRIDCLASKLNQVFMNTLNNAIYAIKASENKEHGKIDISTFVSEDSKEINISFKDNGSGMDEETLRKIFDPFFTTKEVGEGSGLGMSISHGIIEEHGGKFVVESTIGHGTNITVVLPVQSNFETND